MLWQAVIQKWLLVVLNDETVNMYKLQQMAFGAKTFFKVQSKY